MGSGTGWGECFNVAGSDTTLSEKKKKKLVTRSGQSTADTQTYSVFNQTLLQINSFHTCGVIGVCKQGY